MHNQAQNLTDSLIDKEVLNAQVVFLGKLKRDEVRFSLRGATLCHE